MYSQTYIAVAVMVLAKVLPQLGIVSSTDSLTTTITTLIAIGAGVWALIRRYQGGGVTLAGIRKA